MTSVDPSHQTVKVALQPEGVLTGWLPILCAWAGAGWGMVCPPSPGNQVLVLAQEGHPEHGVVVGAVFSAQQAPPNAAVGELWLVHGSGSSIKLLNDGTVQVIGDLHVTGDVYDSCGPMSRLRSHYDSHTHNVPQGGVTSVASQQD